jgi:hypothetical protein
MKKTRHSFAFGSSQRNRMTLMFGAARFWRPGLNASPRFGFRITPRGIDAAPRRPMLHKCFKERRISKRTKLRALRCGLSASSAALFRCRRRVQRRDLPSVCRNAPEVCRKTR